MRAFVGQELAHVEPDATGADHGNARPHRDGTIDHRGIGVDVRPIGSRDADLARRDTGGQHDLVPAASDQLGGRSRM